jgi:hypothetical protein
MFSPMSVNRPFRPGPVFCVDGQSIPGYGKFLSPCLNIFGEHADEDICPVALANTKIFC